jgi:hypothetical protein
VNKYLDHDIDESAIHYRSMVSSCGASAARIGNGLHSLAAAAATATRSHFRDRFAVLAAKRTQTPRSRAVPIPSCCTRPAARSPRRRIRRGGVEGMCEKSATPIGKRAFSRATTAKNLPCITRCRHSPSNIVYTFARADPLKPNPVIAIMLSLSVNQYPITVHTGSYLSMRSDRHQFNAVDNYL